jgi:hypothetical protein
MMSVPKVPERQSTVPGPRTIVRLDVAEQSLPVLLEGINAVRCWLTDEGEGLYAFHAAQTLGESREQPGKPAADLLRELVNEFADGLDAADVPQHLRDAWAMLVARYTAATVVRER